MSPKRSRLPGAHILLLAIVTLVGAVLAAAAEQGIAAKWSAAGGSVVKFSQDAVRNGFIASVLVVITWMIQEREKAAELVQEQRLEAIQLRQSQSEYVLGHGGSIALAVSGWSQVPKATAWDGPAQMPLSREALDDLSAEAEAWRALANRIEAITHQEIQSDNDIRSAYENLWAVPGYLTTYVAEGSRLRRLVYLGRLVDDLAVVETSPKSELAGAAHAFRTESTVLTGWVQHTNTAVIEALVVEREIGRYGLPLESNTLFEEDTGRLPTAAINHDCLYLLQFHLERMRAALGPSMEVDPVRARLLFQQVVRPLGALRNELRALANCEDALVALAKEALSLYDETGQTVAR